MFTQKIQPTSDSCMSTCIAIVAGLDENWAYSQWHHKFQDKKAWLDDALNEYNIPFFYGLPKQGRLERGFAYLLTVASLNIVGGLHEVVVVVPEEGPVKVIDPNKGRMLTNKKPAKYYTYGQSQGKDEVSLLYWTIDVAIPLKKEDKADENP